MTRELARPAVRRCVEPAPTRRFDRRPAPGPLVLRDTALRTVPRRSRLGALGALALLVAALAPGCTTPERRYEILTIFFDPPPALVAAHGASSDAEPKPAVLASLPPEPPRPKLPEYRAHEPYAEEACADCHESRFSASMRLQGADLCWSCHKREDFPGRVVHGPMAAGRCDTCHEPHESQYPSLLVLSMPELCTSCHEGDTFSESEQHREKHWDDCLRCHDPHSSDRRYMLEATVDLS